MHASQQHTQILATPAANSKLTNNQQPATQLLLHLSVACHQFGIEIQVCCYCYCSCLPAAVLSSSRNDPLGRPQSMRLCMCVCVCVCERASLALNIWNMRLLCATYVSPLTTFRRRACLAFCRYTSMSAWYTIRSSLVHTACRTSFLPAWLCKYLWFYTFFTRNRWAAYAMLQIFCRFRFTCECHMTTTPPG